MKFYLVKMCPIFVSSQLSCLARYQKILRGCSFGCKNVLNFTCHTMKFHKCHHPSQHLMKNGSCIIHYSEHEHRFCIHFAMLQSFSLDCAPFGVHTYTLCSYNTNCYHIFVKGDWAVQVMAKGCQTIIHSQTWL